MIHSLEHVALNVRDFDASLAFYRGFLGMDVILENEVKDEKLGKVIGVPGAKCKYVHLKIGDGVLELFQYTDPRGKNIAKSIQQYDVGFTHISFKVTAFHAELARLREQRVEFLGEPVEFRPGVWVVYFRGPDGEVIEYRQT